MVPICLLQLHAAKVPPDVCVCQSYGVVGYQQNLLVKFLKLERNKQGNYLATYQNPHIQNSWKFKSPANDSRDKK